MRDLTILCFLVLAVAAGAFAGSAAAIHACKAQDAHDMIVLRGQVEPAVTRLFTRTGQS